jgi:hypothetical protein
MPLSRSVRIATQWGESKSRDQRVSMFCLRVVLVSLAAIFFLFPHAAKAASVEIPGTGYYACLTSGNIYYPDCVDNAYNILNGPGLDPSPGPLVSQGATQGNPPAGITYIPPTGAWDFPDGDSAICTDCGVFDWYTEIGVTGLPSACDTEAGAFGNSSCEITISGAISAEGYVATALGQLPGEGYGGYLGNGGGPTLFNTASATSFSMTYYALNGGNYLDFIFTGCDSYNPGLPYPGALIAGYCNPTGNYNEPITALYVDPSWTIAAPGTPVSDISESVLIADGGVAPASAVPEPNNLLLLATSLLVMSAMDVLRRKRKRARYQQSDRRAVV